jgi:hypothetical protein
VLFTLLVLAQPAAAPAEFVGVGSLDGQVDPALARRVSHALHSALGLRPADDPNAVALRASYNRIQETFRTGAVAPSAAALERMCRRTERPDTPWTAAVVDLLAEMRLDLGQMQLLSANEAGAAASFRAHHALRPERGPDPARFRPDVVAAYERLALVPLAGAKRRVTLSSAPAGAVVTLDGRSVGVAPLRLEGLTLGTHLLRIELGDRIVQRPLVITRESPPEVRVDLAVDPSALRVVLSAWRDRRGPEAVAKALRSGGFIGDSKPGAWLVGVAAAGTDLRLIAARFSSQGQLDALQTFVVSRDGSTLKAWIQTLRGFAIRPAPPPAAAVMEELFGRPAPARRRTALIAAGAAAAVGALGIGALVIWSRQQDFSGIVIDPEGL